MRDSINQLKAGGTAPITESQGVKQGAGSVPANPRNFFDSHYKSQSVQGLDDRATIGPVTDIESVFHYNATENSIIRAMCRRTPPPPAQMSVTWQMLMARQEPRLLDVGSGAGHWIDFMRETFFVKEAVGVELVDDAVSFLKDKYQDQSEVSILKADVSADDFDAGVIGGTVDLVTAIGVMFHVIDDARWEKAIRNIADLLKPDALFIVGGDFGAKTEDVEFVKTDTFSSSREYHQFVAQGQALVSKRIRSLDHWQQVATACGLSVADLVRSQRDERITTPENDILLLIKQ